MRSLIRSFARFLLFACAGLLAGCWIQLSYDDVSHDKDYKHLVGSRYEVIGQVDVYGIRRHSQAPADYMAMIARPGIMGPEVAFEFPVKHGSTITVTKVLQADYALFESGLALEVELQGTPLPYSGQIIIVLSRNDVGKERASLNPAVYRRL